MMNEFHGSTDSIVLSVAEWGVMERVTAMHRRQSFGVRPRDADGQDDQLGEADLPTPGRTQPVYGAAGRFLEQWRLWIRDRQREIEAHEGTRADEKFQSQEAFARAVVDVLGEMKQPAKTHSIVNLLGGTCGGGPRSDPQMWHRACKAALWELIATPSLWPRSVSWHADNSVLADALSDSVPEPQRVRYQPASMSPCELFLTACRLLFPGRDANQLTQETQRNRFWFFDPRLAGWWCPATNQEASFEICRLSFFAKYAQIGGDCNPVELIRVSGEKRFLQITPANSREERGRDEIAQRARIRERRHELLTATGELTIDALRAGVRVTFVYPDTRSATGAKVSAETFRQIATELLREDEEAIARLHLVPVDPSLRRSPADAAPFVGEMLSRSWRYVWHAKPDGQILGARSPAHRLLLVSRSPMLGPAAFPCTRSEKDRFEEWLEAYVRPQVRLPLSTAVEAR